jgi:hypothetical protein
MDEIRTQITSVKVPPKKPLAFERTKAGPPKRLTVLVYGPPGSGKTYFAGTFPDPFFLDCMGGMMTVRAKNVAYHQPVDYDDLLQYVVGLGDTEFKTLVLDTATEAARIIMEKAIKGVREVPQLQDWQQTIERSRQLFRKLLDHEDKHVVVTCEEAIKQDEDTGKILTGPSLPGKLFLEAGALFDCVFHLRSGTKPGTTEKQQMLLTKPEGLYQQVKNRIGNLEKLEVPDFQVIWKKLSST